MNTFGNNFINPMGYSPMGTPIQPYGYQPNPYLTAQQPQSTQQAQPTATNTNKIFVSGIEDVRNRPLLPNSDCLFLDNDKPLLYQKVVDSKGQFEIKVFDITPHTAQEETKQSSAIDLSGYVKTTDLEPIQASITDLKKQLETLKGGNDSGRAE